MPGHHGERDGCRARHCRRLLHRQREVLDRRVDAVAAVNVNGYVPPAFAAGVPASVAVPPPLSVKLTPDGNVPLDLTAGAGTPAAVMVNVPALPTMKLVGPWLVKPRMTSSPIEPTETPLPVLNAMKLASCGCRRRSRGRTP